MADPFPDKIQKLLDGRLIIDAVNNSERRVRVERLVTYCDE